MCIMKYKTINTNTLLFEFTHWRGALYLRRLWINGKYICPKKVYYNCTEKLPELSLLLHRLPVTYNILILFIAFSALCSISDDAI